jgi:hypothetical protein
LLEVEAVEVVTQALSKPELTVDRVAALAAC